MKRSSAKIGMLTVKARNVNYNDPKYFVVPDQTVKELRFWQKDAFKKVKDAAFSLIVAFCGSGKSILQVMLAIHDIVQSNWRQKQLFIVP